MTNRNENSELLKMCCSCDAIVINGKWINEEDNPELNQQKMEEYNDNITSGFCPPCFSKYLENSDLPQDKKDKLNEKYGEKNKEKEE